MLPLLSQAATCQAGRSGGHQLYNSRDASVEDLRQGDHV